MLKVGITGGIGSGKSIVCQVFQTLGIPIFDADAAAKHLMLHNDVVKQQIIDLLGTNTYDENGVNKAFIAKTIFADKAILSSFNNIIHPATIAYSHEWMALQQAPYVIKEAAIFFESGSYKDMDVMVGVFAPLRLRMKRTLQRGKQSKTQIRDILQHQMPDEEKMKKCQYVLYNDERHSIIQQVLAINQVLKG